MTFPQLLFIAGAWVGHAYWLTGLLNNLYSRPISKTVLRLVRAAVGLLILGFPGIFVLQNESIAAALLFTPYLWACLGVGFVVFPCVTIYRLVRPKPSCLLSEETETVDYRQTIDYPKLAGDGRWRWLVGVPLNDVFRVDFTRQTLAIPGLPPAWDGLRILFLSDLHFHGTPGCDWFNAIFAKLEAEPTPDLVLLGGDYVDTDRHVEWLAPLFSRLKWKEHGIAVLGNHDLKHRPDDQRKELISAGYRVLDNRWEVLRIRGVPCAVIGHEGPWFTPPPDLTGLPSDLFKLCISHTPDNFDWGVTHGIQLMCCGHVHGGQIRVPVIGSIFVPSRFGRRFDMGIFAKQQTVMVVGRGLSGKEPLRFRCNPQVLSLTLKVPGE